MLTDPDGRCPACTSDPQGISTVEFYANDWLLATDTTAPYSYTRSDLPGGSWTLRARAYDSYGVAGWSAPVSVTVQAPDAHGPAATETLPVPVPITVTVEVSGTGTGTVTSVPTGLTCSGADLTCTGTFAAGAELDLLAAPDTGMTFVGWAGACRGTTPVCTIAPGSDVLVVARFAPPPPPIVLTYYHTDVLGSVRAITDVTGATVARHDYFAFGESTSSLAGDPRRFTGKERDAETALDYFGARYYRNVWGRFTSVDPGQASGSTTDPQGWNAYAYARNNPLRFVDPDGLEYVFCEAGGICHEGIDDRSWEAALRGGGLVTNGLQLWAIVDGSPVYAGFFYWRPDPINPNSIEALVGRIADMAKPGVDAAVAIGAMQATTFAVARLSAALASYTPAFSATLAHSVANPRLRSFMGELFRSVDRIPGGSAGMLRYELSRGKLIPRHLQKVSDRARELLTIMREEQLTRRDREIAGRVLNDLRRALGGR